MKSCPITAKNITSSDRSYITVLVCVWFGSVMVHFRLLTIEKHVSLNKFVWSLPLQKCFSSSKSKKIDFLVKQLSACFAFNAFV